ncbi:MAG: lipid-binding SYLF domain-containing protein [Azospirillaceae bacterium]|nr:lipid-binding SYLF domain-containing protein [Azospirillaceae bacterium]
MFNRNFGITGLALALFVGAPAAWAASDQQQLVDRARITIDDVRKDKEFGNAPELLRRARAVMIVPQLVKGGFFVGGEGGDAVLLDRSRGKSWSGPAFYTLGSASFGLQIGLEQSELVLFVMSDKALSALMADQFKIGAGAGLAIVTLGSSAEAATTAALHADIIVWASSSGAYAGVTLNGTVIKPRDSYNAAYYGHPVSVSDILRAHRAQNHHADALRQTLAIAGGSAS